MTRRLTASAPFFAQHRDRDRTRGDPRIARSRGIGARDCVLFAGSNSDDAQYHCTEAYRLGGDQLIVDGMFTFGRKVNAWAILGGTGRFRSATGQVDFTAPTPDTFIDTFHFDS